MNDQPVANTDAPHTTPAVDDSNPASRLPCRGCTTDCKNYASCDGFPWRAFENPH